MPARARRREGEGVQSEIERVRNQNDRFYEALSGQNLIRLEQLWSHSAYVRCVHPGWQMVTGWENIRESWRKLFTSKICLTVEPETAEVTLHGRIAVVTCRATMTSFTLDGSKMTTTLATNVFEKTRGRWQLILHHASPVTNSEPAAG
jgi:ketosteroid isomerase-like protein